jgi:hypothetical protein
MYRMRRRRRGVLKRTTKVWRKVYIYIYVAERKFNQIVEGESGGGGTEESSVRVSW